MARFRVKKHIGHLRGILGGSDVSPFDMVEIEAGAYNDSDPAERLESLLQIVGSLVQILYEKGVLAPADVLRATGYCGSFFEIAEDDAPDADAPDADGAE